jgi:hypothetical protein
MAWSDPLAGRRLCPAAGEAPASVLAVDGAEIAAAVCGSPQSSTTCAQLTSARFFRIRGINRRFARSSSRKLNRFCHKEIIELGAIDRPVISKTECLKIVRWSIRNATLCVEQAVRAQDSHAKEWFAKGAIYWRDVAAYWLQVCEMHHARESSAYTVS